MENNLSESEKKEQLAAVYERADQLNLAGYQLAILKGYEKRIYDKGWQNTYGIPFYGMTGVGIVGGSVITGTNRYIYIIDIDIYVPEKRDNVFNEIMSLFGLSEVYVETSPSGGYHIIFFCETKLKSIKNFNFQEQNTSPEHIDHVEFFTNGQVLVAPSMARNKIGKIGMYKRISTVDIFDSAVLSGYEAQNLIIDLANISSKYQSEIYNHNLVTSEAHIALLKETYDKLMVLGFTCTPLFRGNKFPLKPINYHAYNTDIICNITGINVALGKQKDRNYLLCFNYNQVNDQTRAEIMSCAGDGLYIEESVSGDFHIFYRTKEKPNISGKWKLPDDGGKLEILCTEDQTVNIAPTCSYIRGYKGEPVYRTSKIILGSIDNIGFIEIEQIKNYVNQLDPNRRKGRGGINEAHNPEIKDIDMVLKHIHQYGMVSEIDKQIKIVFPNTMELLDTLDIKRSAVPTKEYIRFFSIGVDGDGNNPDALLYNNRSKKKSNKWAGYSVQDFHLGPAISFSKYLCMHEPENFDLLMDKIGCGKVNISVPIETAYTEKTVHIQCDRYISEDVRNQVIDLINEAMQRKLKPRILITAPTGVGKTEMFYWLAEQLKIQMIMALSYTAQVHQGMEHHTIPGVIKGLCENDHNVPVTGSIFMTYDKAPIVQKNIIPENYIMVIDEAHNPVNQIEFRNKQMRNLWELSDRCKAAVLMTATPDYINYKNIDLVIKIEPASPKIKSATVVHYQKDLIKVLPNVIINQHKTGTIDVVYIRNSTTLEKIKYIINSSSDIETHFLNATVKGESPVYDNLINQEQLAANGIFNNGGILFTTNLIVDGVNIHDINIGNIYLVNQYSTTDLVQFPARFRNGYSNYYIFSTGVSRKYGYAMLSRQELAERYYSIASMQKKSYDRINYLINGNSFFSYKSRGNTIQLIDQYELLDDKANIQTERILYKVQQTEAMRTRWDINYLKEYLEESDYKFQIIEEKVTDLFDSSISDDDVESALISRDEDIISRITRLINILKNDSVERKELVSDYLKNKYVNLQRLKEMYNVSNHVNTKRYSDIINDNNCKNLLFKWCTGEDLGADNSLKLLRIKDSIIDSIKRTLNNLEIEMSGKVNKENMYLRFIEVRKWVRELKSGEKSVTITSEMIKEFINKFNDNYVRLYNPDKIDGVVNDLGDIFNVIKSNKSNKTTYLIGEEWTFDNIRGISFAESRRLPEKIK